MYRHFQIIVQYIYIAFKIVLVTTKRKSSFQIEDYKANLLRKLFQNCQNSFPQIVSITSYYLFAGQKSCFSQKFAIVSQNRFDQSFNQYACNV
jgi:hypothetical protein